MRAGSCPESRRRDPILALFSKATCRLLVTYAAALAGNEASPPGAPQAAPFTNRIVKVVLRTVKNSVNGLPTTLDMSRG
jgi:hypothetical protein